MRLPHCGYASADCERLRLYPGLLLLHLTRRCVKWAGHCAQLLQASCAASWLVAQWLALSYSLIPHWSKFNVQVMLCECSSAVFFFLLPRVSPYPLPWSPCLAVSGLQCYEKKAVGESVLLSHIIIMLHLISTHHMSAIVSYQQVAPSFSFWYVCPSGAHLIGEPPITSEGMFDKFETACHLPPPPNSLLFEALESFLLEGKSPLLWPQAFSSFLLLLIIFIVYFVFLLLDVPPLCFPSHDDDHFGRLNNHICHDNFAFWNLKNSMETERMEI